MDSRCTIDVISIPEVGFIVVSEIACVDWKGNVGTITLKNGKTVSYVHNDEKFNVETQLKVFFNF